MIATSIRSYYNLTSVYLYPILKNPNRAIPTGSCVLKTSLFIKMVLTNLSNQLSLNGEKYLDRQLCNLSIITEFFPPDYAATGQLIEELATQLEQQNIKIEVNDDKVVLSATDMDILITSTFDCDMKDSGQTTVPAQMFFDVVRKIPDGAILVKLENSVNLQIKSGKSKYNLLSKINW